MYKWNKETKMFEMEYLPQFREADKDGRIGLRGYMNLIQDSASCLMYFLGKDNGTLHQEYKKAWVYTKYRVHVYRKEGFGIPYKVESWVEKSDSPLICSYGISIEKDGEKLAEGRLESCVLDLERQKITRLCAIDFSNEEVFCERTIDLPEYQRMSRSTDEMEYVYTHEVKYTELDQNRHMTNLRYVDLFMNAFSSDFYEKYWITDFEIHYVQQCYEGEKIEVYQRHVGDTIYLTGVHDNGKTAVTGFFKVQEIDEL